MKDNKKEVTIEELREDKVRPSMPREELLKKTGKEHDGEYILVPKVVD